MGGPPAKAVNFQGRQFREAGISPHPPPVGGASFLPGGATQVDFSPGPRGVCCGSLWDHSLTVFLSADAREALTAPALFLFGHSPAAESVPLQPGWGRSGSRCVLKRISASGLYQFHPFCRDSVTLGLKWQVSVGEERAGCFETNLRDRLLACLLPPPPGNNGAGETPPPMIPAPGHPKIPGPSPSARLRP